jgi:hypothetical protein
LGRNKRRWPFGTSRFWGEIEPWSWLRHLTPWWFLRWLFSRYHLCWAGMVTWKLGHETSWSVSRSCIYPFDFCGFYDGASAEERAEALRIAGEGPVLIFTEGSPHP